MSRLNKFELCLPSAGWMDIKLGDDTFHASYLHNTPVELLKMASKLLLEKVGILTIDQEGSDILFLFEYGTIKAFSFCSEGEDWDRPILVQEIEMNYKEVAKYIYDTISKQERFFILNFNTPYDKEETDEVIKEYDEALEELETDISIYIK